LLVVPPYLQVVSPCPFCTTEGAVCCQLTLAILLSESAGGPHFGGTQGTMWHPSH